jgi:hypothetical protein
MTMNTSTALLIFAAVAALGLATATLVIPIVEQAYAVGGPSERVRIFACQKSGGHAFGFGGCI